MYMLFSFLFFNLSVLCFLFSLYYIISFKSILFEFYLFSLNSAEIYFSVIVDWMSLLFLSVVLFISCMVIFYSKGYMGGDLNFNRFIWLVVLFVLSMVFLIMSPNLISIMLGWDGLGLISYCLVIYYNNWKSFNSGMLTILSNRIGDVALLISIAWMMNYGSWNYINYLDYMKGDFYMLMIMGFVTLACMTKSAQIPFSAWLPAAMAAPTPVSSLVHSSTLVTAGVYLLIRFHVVLSGFIMAGLLIISMMTMFMSGLGANFEYDLKKIIALSTLSQLGIMISILSLGDWLLAYFHLLIHALFKALLFLCAGVVIHNMGNNQDIRYMGGMFFKLPLTCCLFNICNLSLCGVPFMSGFYSKDLIIELMSSGYTNLFVYMIFYLSIGLTMSYSLRLGYYSLLGDYSGAELNNFIDNNKFMLSGMLGLLIIIIFSGSLFMWLIFYTPYFLLMPFIMKFMVLILVALGGWIGYELYKINMSVSGTCVINMFLGSMWNVPFVSFYWSFIPLFCGSEVYIKVDNGWLEYWGGQNLYNIYKMSFYYMNTLFFSSLKLFLFMLVLFMMILF